jgi:hypothetical protein
MVAALSGHSCAPPASGGVLKSSGFACAAVPLELVVAVFIASCAFAAHQSLLHTDPETLRFPQPHDIIKQVYFISDIHIASFVGRPLDHVTTHSAAVGLLT